MAKETRKVTQYKYLTISYLHVAKDGVKHLVGVGVFDDMDLARAYVDEANKTVAKQNTWTIDMGSWTEVKPEESNFNLPFNPVFNLEEHKAELAKRLPRKIVGPKSHETKAKVSGKIENDEATEGDESHKNITESMKGVTIKKKTNQ